MEHDPDGAFANLTRVCEKGTGRAIWVKKESAEKIEDRAIGARRRSLVVGMKGGDGYDAKDAEIKRLEEENMKLLEALKRAKGGGGNGSNGVSSPTKLRQTVSAERDIK
ncbi:hypothetical protein TrRE_jg7257 [Triparma retinervis]|uniref:Uncharacterized protein n=1 Tax=Triparma retinervis TaxID=2557542 RepID=A0A9W6Z7I4_9STRA|nr:hypothetical protein TrRE_jg7257 [Triparma retinervis]